MRDIMNELQLKTDLETCWDLGQKAALARHHRDEASAKSHTDYMRRFIAARPEKFRAQLRAQFDQAYTAESQIHMNANLAWARSSGKL